MTDKLLLRCFIFYGLASILYKDLDRVHIYSSRTPRSLILKVYSVRTYKNIWEPLTGITSNLQTMLEQTLSFILIGENSVIFHVFLDLLVIASNIVKSKLNHLIYIMWKKKLINRQFYIENYSCCHICYLHSSGAFIIYDICCILTQMLTHTEAENISWNQGDTMCWCLSPYSKDSSRFKPRSHWLCMFSPVSAWVFLLPQS